MKRVVVVPKELFYRTDGTYGAPRNLDPHVRQSLIDDGWLEQVEANQNGGMVRLFAPPEDVVIRDEEETASEESEGHHERILTMAEHRQAQRESREAEKVAAHLAHRDQNDADVQEIARQVGVFCRGLDEADVVHPRFGYNQNQDRISALQIFVITEVGRLRDRQNAEE